MRGPGSVFPTCLVEIARPDVGEATVRILRRRGLSTTPTAGTTCCGQPAWNSGQVDEARRVAATTLKALDRTEGPIIVPSGSCTTMIRHGWPELFEGTRHARRVARVAERVHELSQALAALPNPDSAPTPGGGVVSVHDSCHLLRELGVRDEPRAALTATGHEIDEVPAAERCCGFGGTFSVKMPRIAAAMADDKLDDAVAHGATRVIGCDVSCLLHLEGRAEQRGDEVPLELEHLATAIDRADRVAEEGRS